MNKKNMHKYIIANFLFIGLLFTFLWRNCANSTYAAMSYEELEVEIPVMCSTENGDETHEYSVKIESEDDAYPMPNEDTIIVTDDKSTSFVVKVSEPGNYSYKIYQEKGDNEDITYDEKVYIATLFVIDQEGRLSCVLSIKEEEGTSKPDNIGFENVLSVQTETETDETKEKKEKEETEKDSEDESEIESEKETDSVAKGNEKDREETTEEGDKSSIIATGDYYKIGILVAVMAISFVGIVVLIIINKKDSENKQ